MKFLTIVWGCLLLACSGFGITIGAHRLFTHRSFKAVWALRVMLLIFQTMAGQNCTYIWVRDHRQHHKYSDTDADPHNSGRGFFFSHIGWLMMKKHPDVIRLGATIDLSDLEADPLVMFQKKYYLEMYMVFGLFIPISVPLLWGETLQNSLLFCYILRYVLALNITWMVNSWAHVFGTRPYNKNIVPRESRLVAILAVGEGWHNYHHCFPWDYRTSEFGMKNNPSASLIDWFARRGWATDLRTASQNMIRNRVQKLGDGTHALWPAVVDLHVST